MPGKNSFLAAFKAIETEPAVIQFTNNKQVNNEGGHIQGIQWLHHNQQNYIFMTGSSESYSYLAVVKSGNPNEVISINKLMKKPFKHAGGFQIFQNYLAVGIEDNSRKDKAKICIFMITDPENLSTKPIAVIERKGKPYCSTAGCVGITKYKNEILLAVGDWDTKHIDFYSCPFNKIESGKFEKIYTLNSEETEKTGWINPEWTAWQNINLFAFNDRLFLIGLGRNNNEKEIADLFEVKVNQPNSFILTKIASKTFHCTDDITFNAAAGVDLKEDKLSIVSFGYHIERNSFLNYFTPN